MRFPSRSEHLAQERDAVVLGAFDDVTAFVVRHKRVARADVADAVQQYQLTGAPVDGFVFNCFVPSRVRYGYGAAPRG